MRSFALAVLFAAGLAAQDKITITITRGTTTRTAEIPAAAATEAYKALDFYVSQQAPRTLTDISALHELVASMLVGQLRVTPSTAIKAANDAEAVARAAREKAESDFLKASGAPAQ